MNFTQEELNNILYLINSAPITGKDAVAVALLQKKISEMMKPQKPENKEEKPKK